MSFKLSFDDLMNGSIDVNAVAKSLETNYGPSFPQFKPDAKSQPNKKYDAYIRFLPNPYASDLSDIKQHIFENIKYYLQGDGESVYVQSPQMIGEKCPINTEWYKYYKKRETDPIAGQIAKKLSRSVNYSALIYVQEDKTVPENTGKIMVWTFGQTIYDKIQDLIKTEKSESDIDNGEMPQVIPYMLNTSGVFSVNVSTKDQDRWNAYENCKFTKVTQFAFDSKATKNIFNDTKVMAKFKDLYENAPNFVEELKFKPWTKEETEKVNKVVSFITGNNVQVGKAVNNVKESKEEDTVIEDTDDMLSFLG